MTTATVDETELRRLAPSQDYAVSKRGAVWMLDNQACISAARAVAVDAMRSLGMDTSDFRARDALILAISDRVDGMLDHVQQAVSAKPIAVDEPFKVGDVIDTPSGYVIIAEGGRPWAMVSDHPYYPSIDFFATVEESQAAAKEEIERMSAPDGIEKESSVSIVRVMSRTIITTDY